MKWMIVTLNEQTEFFKAFLQVIKKIPDKQESVTFALKNNYLSNHYKKDVMDVFRVNVQYNDGCDGYDVYKQFVEEYE